MPQQVAAIRSVSKADRVIKEISSQGLEWAEDGQWAAVHIHHPATGSPQGAPEKVLRRR